MLSILETQLGNEVFSLIREKLIENKQELSVVVEEADLENELNFYMKNECTLKHVIEMSPGPVGKRFCLVFERSM